MCNLASGLKTAKWTIFKNYQSSKQLEKQRKGNKIGNLANGFNSVACLQSISSKDTTIDKVHKYVHPSVCY